jgi:DNA primase
LLLLLLQFEWLGKAFVTALPHEWIDPRLPSGALLNRFLAEFAEDQWPGRDNLDSLLETDSERALVTSLLFETAKEDDPARVAVLGLEHLRKKALMPRIREIDLALAQSGTDKTVDPGALLKERSALQRCLRSPLALPPGTP